MRSSQKQFRFEDRGDLERAWSQMPAVERVNIAKAYSRILVKAAKIHVSESKESTENKS
jgi:hypothetical protein